MTRTKLGLLGLCAVVFGLMAFGAAAAQAEPGARWLILNANGTLLAEAGLAATVNLKTDVPGVLHSKIGGVAVLFECSTIAAVNAKLLANGSIGEAAGAIKGSKILFSGCITKLNGVTSIPCEPNAGGIAPGHITTAPGHGLIVLHTLASGVKDELVKILPDNNSKGEESKTFATIEMSEECAIGTKVPVIGTAFLRDCQNAFLTHLLEHLVELDHTTTNLTKLWVISETPEHVATILGSAWAFLGGAHVGLKFGGDPA